MNNVIKISYSDDMDLPQCEVYIGTEGCISPSDLLALLKDIIVQEKISLYGATSTKDGSLSVTDYSASSRDTVFLYIDKFILDNGYVKLQSSNINIIEAF